MTIEISTLNLDAVDSQNTVTAPRTVLEPNFDAIKEALRLLAEAINRIDTSGSGGPPTSPGTGGVNASDVGVASNALNMLNSPNVQAALEELQREILAIDTSGMSGTGLTDRQIRTLAAIMEAFSYTFTDVVGATNTPANTDTPPGPSGVFTAFPYTATSAITQRWIYEVPATNEPTLANTFLVVRSADDTILSQLDVSSLSAEGSANVAMRRYVTPTDVVIPAGGSLRLQARMTNYDSYTLSDKFRMDAKGVLVMASDGFSATTTDAAIRKLRAEALTDEQTDLLADIHNANAHGDAYSNIENGRIAVANTDLNGPVGAFSNRRLTTTGTDARYVIEIPDRYDIHGVVLVEYTGSSSALLPVRAHDLGDATDLGARPGNFKRYLAPVLTGVTSGNDLRVQVRDNLYDLRTTAANTTVIPQNGISAADVQEALEELQSEITAIDVPYDASGIATIRTGGVNEANVQLALQALHTEVDSKTALTDSQIRTLAQITESTTGTSLQDVIPTATVTFNLGVAFRPFPYTPPGFGSSVFHIEVPTGTSLAGVSLIEYAGGTQVNSHSTWLSVSGAPAGRERYRTSTNVTYDRGAVLRLQAQRPNYGPYTLSSKVRMPFAGVTGVAASQIPVNAISDLDARNVQTALAELRSDITNSAALSPSQTRILSQVTEGVINAGGTLHDIFPLATVTPADGSSPPRPLSSFASFPYTAPSAATLRFFFELPEGTPQTGLMLVLYGADGTQISSVDVSSLTKQATSTTGMDRYLTPSTISIEAAGYRLRLQSTAAQYGPYELSGQVRLPFSGITGASARGLPVTAAGNLTSTNVQAALEELQADVDSGATGITARQTRTLAEVAETVVDSYEPLTTARISAASGNPEVPSPFGANLDGQLISGHVFIEVPTGTDLSDLYIRGFNPTTNRNAVNYHLEDTTARTSANPGMDRYITKFNIFTNANYTGVRVERLTTTYPLYTLSNKYRVPASGVATTRTGGVDEVNVQLALQALHAEIDNLPSGDGASRKLSNITEGTSNVYTSVATATLAIGASSAPPSTFAETYTGARSPLSARWYVDLPTSVDDSNVYLVRYNADGAFDADLALTDEPKVAGAATGFQRYRTRENFNVTFNQTLRVQSRTISYDTYTLSSKYRLPITGLPTTVRAVLRELEDTAFDPLTEQFLDEVTVTRTVPTTAIAEVYRGANLSPNFSDYTLVTGGDFSIINGADTYVIIPDSMEVSGVAVAGAGGAVVEFEPLGVPVSRTVSGVVSSYRAYRLRTSALANGTNVSVNGGTPTSIKVTFSDNVEVDLDNLASEIDQRLIKSGRTSFFDHVEMSGQLTNTADVMDFYYLPSTMLTTPKRTLTQWTHITNGQVPQPTSTVASRHVILLPEGMHPNSITWDPDVTQPPPSASAPSISSLTRQGFQGIAATLVPEGYEGFQFVMPAWNAASTLRTGAKLNAGTLADANVDRIDFDETVKITDNNLELSSPTAVLTASQQEKLDNLQLKTFTQDRVTTGKPNEHYDLLLASAWPDPMIDYATPGRILLGQDPSVTGIRETGTNISNAGAEFFNLVSQSNITLDEPRPATSAATWLGQIEVAHDYAGCAGLLGGSIQAKDNNSTPRMRIDDDQGVFATTTLHINHRLPAGSYEVMNIGSVTANSANGLVLRKDTNGALSLLAREFTGNPTSTTRQQDVRQQLGASNGAVSQLFRIPQDHVGESLNSVKGWVIPDSLTASSASPIRLQWFIRVWNNDNDEGVHDFTSSMPEAFRSLSSKNVINPQNFTLNFTSAGFTEGPSTVSCNMRLRAASAGNLPEIFFQMTLTNSAIAYEVTAYAVTTQTVTVPAGSTRDFPLEGMDYLNRSVDRFGTVSYDQGDRDVELGFYVFSQAQASTTGTRTLRYQASANGDVSDVRDSTEAAPTGAVPVTFGINGNNNFAVNRFAIFRPKTAGFDRNSMRDLTTKSLRNRPIVGGLIRQAGGTFHEVFSPAYKAVTYSVSALTSLPGGTTVYPNWNADTDEPPELNHVSGTSTFTATTNFVGLVTVSANVEVEFTGAVTTIPARSLILVDGTLQEQLSGSNTWTDVAGPRLYEEIVQGNLRPSNRPEIVGSVNHPRVRRGYNTTVQFKRGATYRFDITGHRLASGGAWPTTTNLVRLPAKQTFLQIAILPTA